MKFFLNRRELGVLLIVLTICLFHITLVFAQKGEEYRNPVFARDFPDPTVIRGHNGFFYSYATQAIVAGDTFNIQVARSRNLIDWQFIGDALPVKPFWADSTQNFWAPHVLYDQQSNTYFMYYSGESDENAIGKCLGVATAKKPEGPFVDKGTPLLCGDSFVNIDPMAFDDPRTNRKFLYWGSAFLPIKVRELTDDRLDFKAHTAPVDVVFPGKDADYKNLIEGAWVEYYDNYYYLFYSGDNCCGDKANYAVMVARAKSPEGPFERMGESNSRNSSTILVKNGVWNAPGHNSIVKDGKGNYWIVYHAIERARPLLNEEEQIVGDRKDRRIMLIDKLAYKKGWPYIEGGSPSTKPTEAPVVKAD